MTWFKIWGNRCTGSMLKSWYGIGHRDFRGAILDRASLDGANLSGASLEGADLKHANMDGADLGGSILSRANLYMANLKRAFLFGSRLEGCDSLISYGKEEGNGRHYRRYLQPVGPDGQPRILAGCRYFTFAEARKHWGSPGYFNPRRGKEYLSLIDRMEKDLEEGK